MIGYSDTLFKVYETKDFIQVNIAKVGWPK